MRRKITSNQFSENALKLLDAAPLLGCGKSVEQLRQAGLLAAQDVSDLWRVLSRLEGLVRKISSRARRSSTACADCNLRPLCAASSI